MAKETNRAKLIRGLSGIPGAMSEEAMMAICGDGFDESDESISPIHYRQPVVRAFTKIIQESVDPKSELVIPHFSGIDRRIESVDISGDWFSVREVLCGPLVMYKMGVYDSHNSYPVVLRPKDEVRVTIYNRSKRPRLVTVTIKGVEVK